MKKVLLGIVMLLGLAACGANASVTAEPTLGTVPSEYSGMTNPLGADAATDGAKIYKSNCESCHGPQGHGDGPAGAALIPPPRNLPDLAAQVDDDYLFWRISAGSPGTPMVAWKGIMTDEQIWQTVAYIRTLR